jgi:hypothetical protein
MNLADKATTLRTQLGIAARTTVAQAVDEAEKQLGISSAEIRGMNLANRADLCLRRLGVAPVEEPLAMGMPVQAVTTATIVPATIVQPVQAAIPMVASVQSVAPVPQAMRNRELKRPPNPSGRPHPEGGNYFWQYYQQPEVCPNENGGCSRVVLPGAACVHGEITSWTHGEDKTCEWIMCGLFAPCMIEADRRAIEAKIHGFHRERGDPRATGEPFKHEGACFIAFLSPFFAWIMHAQNYEVMRKFRQVQGV